MKRLLLALTVFFLAMGVALAQRTITGTVLGDDGEALIGASVRVQGTNRGAITDIDGRYSVEVPNGATTLSVTYTGFETQEITLGTSNVADVTLAAGVLLEEAVVTALGITRDEKSIGYAQQTIGGDRISEARGTNLVNALSGQVSGVNVVSSSGNVGSSSRIVIRGNSSLTGNSQPLFVVNGVPMDNSTNSYSYDSRGNQFGGVDFGNAISDINPDDIESMTVLKGANAAALYGSRGANGVIMITTKKGTNAKQGLGVTYTGSVEFSNPLRLPSYQNKFGQGLGYQFNYVDGNNSATGSLNDGVDESWGPAFDAALNAADGIDNDGDGEIDETGEGVLINQFTGQNMPWVARPNNIRDAFDTGVGITNSLAVTGTTEKVNSRLSLSNLSQTGMVPNTNMNRTTINGALGIKMGEKLHSDLNMTYTLVDSDNRPGVGYDGDNILQQSIWAGRQVDWQYLRDNWDQRDEFGQIVNWNHNYQNNPFFTLNRNTKPQRRDRINGYYSLTYDLASWLKLMGRVGTDFYKENRQARFDQETNTFPSGFFANQDFTFNETNYDVLLSANKYLNDNFSISATAGLNRRDYQFVQNTQTANALVVPNLFTINNVSGNAEASTLTTRNRVNAAFGSVSFGYNNFLYLDVTGRNDWSSTLPAANNSYFYPSVNMSIVASEKINIPGINYLKFRGGWAQAGKDAQAHSLAQTLAATTIWGGVSAFGVPNTNPNPNLIPEIATTYEAGVEIRAIKDRVRLDLTYYNTQTDNQIVNLASSGATGVSDRLINAGTIENKGIELHLGLTPVRTRDFTWDMDVNWAKNQNTVLDLPEGATEITLNTNWGLRLVAREGEPFGVLVGRRVKRAPDGQIILNNGLPVLDVDANGSNTNFTLGSIQPDWTGGLRNTFTYKGFSLGALIDVRQGSDLFSMSYIFGRYAGVLEETLEGRNTLEEVQNGYAYEGVIDNGDGTYSPNDVKVSAEDWNAFYYARRHDRGVFDASFVKLREVTLGYSIPKSVLSKTGLENLRFNLYGRNLAILKSNVPHIDPETGFDASTAQQGIEFGQLPSARTFGISLSTSF